MFSASVLGYFKNSRRTWQISCLPRRPSQETFRSTTCRQKDFQDRFQTHPSIAWGALWIWQGSSWRKDSSSAGSRKGKVSRNTFGLVTTLRGSTNEIWSRTQSLRRRSGTVIWTCSSRSPSIEAIFSHTSNQGTLSQSRTSSENLSKNTSTNMEHFSSSGRVIFRKRMALRCGGIRSSGKVSRWSVSRSSTLQE